MERKQETLFDILPGLQAAILDSTELEDMCRKQQSLTMERVAYWLQGRGKLKLANGESSLSSQYQILSEELFYLSSLPLTFFSDGDL